MEVAKELLDPSLKDKLVDLTNNASQKKGPNDVSVIPERITNMVNSGGGLAVFDLERMIGNNDLVKINYLSRGLSAAASVCRIFVGDTVGNGGLWGTGFLIAPDLLITNCHVIGSSQDATNAFAEFEYETDASGVLKQGKRFKFRPDLAFVSSPTVKLDFTIVGIEVVSEDGQTPLNKYGFLRLIPDKNKILESEFVTIVQHPQGDQKCIALRENKVIKIGDQPGNIIDNFIWYSSDTAEGSSGAANFNDNWQVIAVHHRSVPLTKVDNGVIYCQLVDLTWKNQDEIDLKNDRVKFIANEGIRVSSIVNETIALYNAMPAENKSQSKAIKAFIDDATGVKYYSNTNVGASINKVATDVTSVGVFEAFKTPSKNVRPLDHYDGRKGYQSDFLKVNIPLPKILAKGLEFGSLATASDSGEEELRYTNFSIKFNADRKMAFYTAVNIDGKKWRNIKRGTDKWFYDPRLPIDMQIGDEFYGNEPSNLGSKGWFDRGHLVRRMDPDWGTMAVAAQADEDTFHWANCSPQYWGFNQGKQLWAGLEDYILNNTDQEDIKAIVFSGPIFSKSDEEHRGILIPQYFWKVVVVNDSQGKLFSSAYSVSQKKYAQNVPFEELPVGDFNHFQMKIAKLQNLIGLEFASAILESDVFKNHSDTDEGLRSLADVKMPRRQ